MPLLQQMISSKHFTEIKAYWRLYTFNPDLWFASQQNAIAARGGSFRLPMKLVDDGQQRRRDAERAERQMDAE